MPLQGGGSNPHVLRSGAALGFTHARSFDLPDNPVLSIEQMRNLGRGQDNSPRPALVRDTGRSHH